MRDFLVSTPRVMRWLSLLAPLALAACSSAPPLNPSPSAPSAPTPVARSANGKPLPALPAAGSGRGGYYKDDGPGDQPPEGLLDTPDAEPRVEPYSKSALRPYTVFGKTYTPISDNRPFKQRGIGSWYGKKFHGQKTSSGELYDMYKMSAAHPTLPIPSYARVTNLKTGAQVIVRINDRGPFHSTRIIDLSYTAALKLGYLSSGSSELEVERLLPDEIARMAENKRNGIPDTATAAPAAEVVSVGSVTPPGQIMPVAMTTAPAVATSSSSPASASAGTALASGFYLQFGAYAQEANALAARDKLMQGLGGAVEKMEAVVVNGLYRLYAGPYATRPAAMDAAQVVRQRSSVTPFVVER
ncbi:MULTISPECIES: septal ring lytic transglycosylase RlpA family protein [unclassified Herbaspirillum]|uniref:septal ring lytic transglycosylase RlpA family protein n=1 Tax=unclassified Herbaspirillum TaxID=2624150 RepID=UPI000E2E6255|nr:MULTISPECIES: septal ring lytic transglycosylase RlpA family protein [unclassified Herbaspirillum]RFB68077.1 septal ring lytic transglycosylase RlpA family protein [Herbaspirillum sp. 3R-3a1]TFI06522.1 septal ring lytic transglycosylase RlpA family protein [Herbaspirillum sp. 3R11]TFI13866.1 septal ring lytic transglycosylase RlpA family protein [Herbaspirillum sp. 3R-11]TFI31061.1 septal ring lytic transglycosylase RlpA family protein [Herbaspirillum sp. 3C11]